ncbi:hypothetical protein GW17_00060466 [Ensete ventricosum]|nr:hypothetical protein GW17_00060466 [Ensete ventricosum]
MASYPIGASDCAENSQFLACYRVVPPKLTVGGQLREKSTVGGRLREKKKEEEKKEVPPFPVLSSPSRHRRPRLWAIFLPREETEHLPVQGERLRRPVRIGPPTDRNADCSLLSDTVDWGYFHPITT